jgi:hypothetical protein
MRKPKQTILPKWMNWRQIHEYLGGNIGRDRILKAMKSNVIESSWFGNKILAKRESVLAYSEQIFNKPIQDGIIESIPIEYLHQIVRNTVG